MATGWQIFIMTPQQNQITIGQHTATKDIIHFNQLLHFRAVKTKTLHLLYKKDHWNDECKEFLNIRSSKQKVHGLCYICLKKYICQKIAVLQSFVDIVKRKIIITKVSAESSFLSTAQEARGNLKYSWCKYEGKFQIFQMKLLKESGCFWILVKKMEQIIYLLTHLVQRKQIIWRRFCGNW